MTFDGTKLGKDIATAIKTCLFPRIEATERRLDGLEARLDKTMTYNGIFSRAVAYPKGATVSHAGSLWYAIRSVCAEQPGSSDSWCLIAKSGSAITGQSSSVKLRAAGGSR